MNTVPVPRTELDVATYAVMETAREAIEKARNTSAQTVMNRVGRRHKLPRLTWTYRTEPAGITGLASEGDFEPAAAVDAVQRWGEALGLERSPDFLNPGTLDYTGETVYGLPVSVWTVVDRAAWEGTVRRADGGPE